MAFQTRKLTPAQTVQLRAVYAADQHWRNLKQTARAELERLLEERLSDALRVRDMEVRASFDMGIPKARISRDGLSTTAPVTVNESLARTACQHTRLTESVAA